MHEWMFRSGLDHYATFFGMLTAYHFEGFKRFTEHLRSPLLRLVTVALCGYVALASVGLFLLPFWDTYDCSVSDTATICQVGFPASLPSCQALQHVT
jgi:hypothetical protein